MNLRVEINRETDGTWIGEVPDLPGVFAYGLSRGEAIDRAKAFALRALADRLERGEYVPYLGELFTAGPASAGLEYGGAVDDADCQRPDQQSENGHPHSR